MRRWLPASLALLVAAAALAAAGPGYKVVNTYKIGGEGGWDYLTADAAARRLYISRATHVIVLDLDSGKTVGDIADTPGVHGIALAPGSTPSCSRRVISATAAPLPDCSFCENDMGTKVATVSSTASRNPLFVLIQMPPNCSNVEL